MAEQQAPLEISGMDWFGPDVRRAGLRLLANASSSEYLPAVVDDTIKHKQPQLSEILAFLAVFGHEAVRQFHSQDGAARFIGDELDTADFAQLLDHLDVAVSEWKQGS